MIKRIILVNGNILGGIKSLKIRSNENRYFLQMSDTRLLTFVSPFFCPIVWTHATFSIICLLRGTVNSFMLSFRKILLVFLFFVVCIVSGYLIFTFGRLR